MALKQLSVLWLSPFFPYPPDHGGAVRLYNLLRHLASNCKITLMTLADAPVNPASIAAMESFGLSVHTFVRSHHPRLCTARLAPPAVYLDDVPEMRLAVQQFQKEQPADVLQIDYPSLTTYLDYRKNSVTCFTDLDVTFVACYRRFRNERWGIRKLRRLMAFLTFFYYELRHLPRYDTVVTMSEYDRQTLLKWLPRLRTAIIPNGVDCDYFTPPEHLSSTPTLLFVGNFQHPPNVDAVMYFVREIWPALATQFPTLRFLVVGDPTPEIEALANERIILTGRARNHPVFPGMPLIPDLRDYYAHASVVMIPVRFGSGTRLKLLEAFAAGIPVVSTSMGAEGVEVESGIHFLLADSPRIFVEQTARLLKDPALADRLRYKARQLVEARYDWKVLAQQQLELYIQTWQRRQSGG